MSDAGGGVWNDVALTRDRSAQGRLIHGAGDGNRTHVRSLGSFYTAIVRRPLVVSDCTQELIFRKATTTSHYAIICRLVSGTTAAFRAGLL